MCIRILYGRISEHLQFCIASGAASGAAGGKAGGRDGTVLRLPQCRRRIHLRRRARDVQERRCESLCLLSHLCQSLRTSIFIQYKYSTRRVLVLYMYKLYVHQRNTMYSIQYGTLLKILKLFYHKNVGVADGKKVRAFLRVTPFTRHNTGPISCSSLVKKRTSTRTCVYKL